jgi:hypothetical protein
MDPGLNSSEDIPYMFSVYILYPLSRNSYRREVREELYRAVGEALGGVRIKRLSEAINAVRNMF